MHHATALSLDLPPDRGWHRGVRVLALTVVVTTLVWQGWHAGPSGSVVNPVLVVGALSMLPAFWLWRGRQDAVASVRHLAWHPLEGHWSLRTPGQPDTLHLGRIDCLADTGHWMLLCHRSPGLRPAWIPVSQRDHAAHWHALRCAVFSPGASARTPHTTPHTPTPADE